MTLRGNDPLTQYLSRRAAIDAAVQRVLESGCYLHGPEVVRLEEEFAAFVGVRSAVACGSGTQALWLALRALQIGPGDEVITCSHTAVATVAAIELAGAVPVLIDVEPEHYTLDPALLATACSARTKAILPVHLYGHPANMDAICQFAQTHRLRVIEDCAQAHGASWRGQSVGSIGDAGCFSFYPTKNLAALGDAGILVTDDAALAEEARAIHEYGWNEQRVSCRAGGSARMDEIQAAVLRVRLPYLKEDNAARQALADAYRAELDSSVTLPVVHPDAKHVYHQFVIRAPRRDELEQALAVHGIQAGVHYRQAVHQQPAYAGRIRCSSSLAVTERLAQEVLSLPVHPQVTRAQVVVVAQAVRNFYTRGLD